VLHPLHSERDNVTELLELADRVTRLEARVDDVEHLARGTGKEVSEWRTTLNNHMKTLNAIRENQIDQGKKLASFEEHFGEFEARVDKKFALLHRGQEQITDLLTRHLGEPNEEASSGE
jgi:hypothetical protein